MNRSLIVGERICDQQILAVTIATKRELTAWKVSGYQMRNSMKMSFNLEVRLLG